MNLDNLLYKQKEIVSKFLKDKNLKVNQFNLSNMMGTDMQIDLENEFKRQGLRIPHSTRQKGNKLF